MIGNPVYILVEDFIGSHLATNNSFIPNEQIYQFFNTHYPSHSMSKIAMGKLFDQLADDVSFTSTQIKNGPKAGRRLYKHTWEVEELTNTKIRCKK